MYLIYKNTDKSIKRQISFYHGSLIPSHFPPLSQFACFHHFWGIWIEKLGFLGSPVDPGTVQGMGIWYLLKSTVPTAMPSNNWLSLCSSCLLSYGLLAFCVVTRMLGFPAFLLPDHQTQASRHDANADSECSFQVTRLKASCTACDPLSKIPKT